MSEPYTDELVIDYGPEWREFDDKPSRSRVGPPPTLLSVQQVTTTIGDPRLDRLNKLVAIRLGANTRLYRMLRDLNRHLAMLGLLDGEKRYIAERAATVLRRIHNARLGHHCGTDSLAVHNSIAIALLGDNSLPIVWDLVSKLPDLPWSNMHEMMLSIYKCMHGLLKRTGYKPPRPAPRELGRRTIEWLAARLGIKPFTTYLAHRIYMGMATRTTSSPSSLAAAAVYLAAKLAGEYVTMEKVAKAAGINEATIRNTLRRVGVHIVYRIECNGHEVLTEWWPGKDTFGARSRTDLEILYNVVLGTPRIEVKPADKLYIRATYKCVGGGGGGEG